MSEAPDMLARLDDWLDGADDDAASILRWIESDPANADAIAQRMLLHAAIRTMLRSSSRDTRGHIAAPSKPVIARPAWRIGAWTAAAAAMLVAGGVTLALIVLLGGDGSGPADTRDPAAPALAPVAVLLEADGVNWDSDLLAPGDAVAPQRLAIRSGRIEMNLHSGTELKLTGPAEMTVLGRSGVRLTRGSLHAVATPGFTVEAPGAVRITDLGTEFIVTIGPDGGARVGVIDGEVETRGADAQATRLGVRSAIVYNAVGEVVERINELVGGHTAAMYLLEGMTEPAGPVPSLFGGAELESAAAGVYSGDLPLGDATDNWIIEARVRPDTIQGVGIVAYHGDSSRSGYGLIQDDNQWTVVFGGVAVFRFNATVETGRWTDLAAVRHNGVTRLYVNGQSVGAPSTAAPRPSTAGLMIGGGGHSVDQVFAGAIDRVRLARLTDSFDPVNLEPGQRDRLDPSAVPVDQKELDKGALK